MIDDTGRKRKLEMATNSGNGNGFIQLKGLSKSFEEGGQSRTVLRGADAEFTRGELVAILGRGEVKQALTVKAHRFSASARDKVEAAGGIVEELPWHRGGYRTR